MENLRLPFGVGLLFHQLNSWFPSQLSISKHLRHSFQPFQKKKKKELIKTHTHTHKYLQRNNLRINTSVLMMTITKVKTQIQIFLKVSLHKKNSHGEVFVLENYQCPFFSFIIEEAKGKQQAFPTKAPFQHLQLFATQMFHITVLMVFYILWTIFSSASIVRHKADFPNKIWKPY